MFLPSDNISEVIAHFIGSFEIRVDEMRMRQAYEEFYHEQMQRTVGPIEFLSPGFFQRLDLDAFTPGVHYRPHFDASAGAPVMVAPPIHVTDSVGAAAIWIPNWSTAHANGQDVGAASEPAYVGTDPGSVMLSAQQVMLLDDNDFIVVGTIEVGHIRFLADAGPMEALLETALTVSDAFASAEAPANLDAIPGFFEAMHAAITAVEADLSSEGTAVVSAIQHIVTEGLIGSTTVVVGPAIEGVYADGVQVAEAPSLYDALPMALQEAVAAAEVPTPTLVIDPTDVSMTLQSGANMVVNEAIITNAGLTSTFMAVAGDYHAINAIIQTNVYSDNDLVDSRLPGAARAEGGTSAHNVATFGFEARDAAAEKAMDHAGEYPAFWQVSVVEGDMVFLDWIEQYSFTTDSDTHVLTATGTTTTITSGENLGLNSVSFMDLGHHYDLILVGGSLFDGNFIIQTNVLYDNDLVAMLSGTAGAGTVSTGGNLLWNSASILNVGAGNISSGLPDGVGDAMSSLLSGNHSMPDSLQHNGLFEGFNALRVLMIEGNLYDLHSIRQVNVMGDADLVALYEDEVRADDDGPEWDISTGSNALINLATIIDYDSLGSDVHIGGQIYSDAILIQADLMAASDVATPSDDALVNEVIAFLDIDLDVAVPGDADHSIIHASDGCSVDVMQSVLA